MENPGFIAPTIQLTSMSVSGAAPLDPPEAEIARPEVVAQSESTGKEGWYSARGRERIGPR